MDVKVWALCGVAAGFLLCVAALAGSIETARSRMAVGKSPICGPDQAASAKSTAVPIPPAR